MGGGMRTWGGGLMKTIGDLEIVIARCGSSLEWALALL
jgi:hypothetical protein